MRFSEPMNDLIQIRVMHDEKRYLAEAARKRGMTISDFIRRSALLGPQHSDLSQPGDLSMGAQ